MRCWLHTEFFFDDNPSHVAFSYVVRCSFDEPEAMARFLAWLRDRHLADVCAAGALDAELVVLDPVGEDAAHVLEARYRFASREAFQRYEREDAPRLRSEGMKEIARLGISVKMTRMTGELIAHTPSSYAAARAR